VHLRKIRGEIGVRYGKVHFRRKIVGAVVPEAEAGLKFLNGQELQGRDTQFGEMGQLARHVEKRPPVLGEVRCEKGADVELIDDELMKARRDIAGLTPREIGLADNTVAPEGGRQLTGGGIAVYPF